MKEAKKIVDFIAEYTKRLPDYPWYYYLLSILIFVTVLYIVYNYLNKKFINKNGYPIINWLEVGLVCGHGSFLFAGTSWKEYAIENGKKVIYPNLLLGYSWFGIIFFLLGLIAYYYKEKRKLGWLNIILAIFLTYILYAFTGIFLIIIFIVATFIRVGSSPKKPYPKRNYNQEMIDRAYGEEQARLYQNTVGPTFKREDEYY